MVKEKYRFYFLWLGLVCLGMFILQILIAGFTELFILSPGAIYNIEIWRFVSAIFMHGSLLHLMFNFFALIFFGAVLEKLIGGKNFLLVFFGSGIIANVISINFYNYSLGASGAIYGIIGTLAILNPMMMVWAFGIIMPMFVAAIIWIIADVIGVFYPSNAGNIAHLSGIAIGFFLGIIYRIRYKNKFKRTSKYSFIIPESDMRNWEERYIK
ncbi:MAG: rhomboid family intramembrane serine protease [Nanoarchaeota archaeon]|nr:rhomboid family intramembrane serine protease [Nanoarchaeota archaeon]